MAQRGDPNYTGDQAMPPPMTAGDEPNQMPEPHLPPVPHGAEERPDDGHHAVAVSPTSTTSVLGHETSTPAHVPDRGIGAPRTRRRAASARRLRPSEFPREPEPPRDIHGIFTPKKPAPLGPGQGVQHQRPVHPPEEHPGIKTSRPRSPPADDSSTQAREHGHAREAPALWPRKHWSDSRS